MSTLTVTDEMDGSMYFAMPVELDYDEPNAVVDDMELEFVVADQFVQMVELPVEAVVVEEVLVKGRGCLVVGVQREAA